MNAITESLPQRDHVRSQTGPLARLLGALLFAGFPSLFWAVLVNCATGAFGVSLSTSFLGGFAVTTFVFLLGFWALLNGATEDRNSNTGTAGAIEPNTGPRPKEL